MNPSCHSLSTNQSLYLTTHGPVDVFICIYLKAGFPSGSDGKEFACNAGDPSSIPGLGRSSEVGMATHFGILA